MNRYPDLSIPFMATDYDPAIYDPYVPARNEPFDEEVEMEKTGTNGFTDIDE